MYDSTPPLFITRGGPDDDDDCDQMFGVIVKDNHVMPPAFSKAGASFWLDCVKPYLTEGERQILSDEIQNAPLQTNLINHDRRVMAAVASLEIDRLYGMFAQPRTGANRLLIEAALGGEIPVEYDPIYGSLLKVFEEIVKTIW